MGYVCVIYVHRMLCIMQSMECSIEKGKGEGKRYESCSMKPVGWLQCGENGSMEYKYGRSGE